MLSIRYVRASNLLPVELVALSSLVSMLLRRWFASEIRMLVSSIRLPMFRSRASIFSLVASCPFSRRPSLSSVVIAVVMAFYLSLRSLWSPSRERRPLYTVIMQC